MGRLARSLGLEPRVALAAPAPLAEASLAVFPSPLRATDLTAEQASAFGFTIDVEADRITRREAMRIPAVRRGRAIVAGTVGAMHWQTRRGTEDIRSPLIDHPDPNTTPQWVYTWLVDDLLFNGVAWWRALAWDTHGFPIRIARVQRERLNIVSESDGFGRNRARFYIDGVRITDPDRELIRFDGPDEGVLEYGATTLRTCLMLERAVRKFARLDVPLGYLRPAEGASELSMAPGSAGIPDDERSEVDVLLDEWENAREHRTTAFLNRAVEYSTVMFDAQRVQLSEARQYQSAEVARLINLPPRYVNAPQASGMTYSTSVADRLDLYDTTLNQYATAIAQRLSMPDITARGQSVGPDITAWLNSDTRAVLDAGAVAIDADVMSAEEVRTDWLKLPARPGWTPRDRASDAPSPLEK